MQIHSASTQEVSRPTESAPSANLKTYIYAGKLFDSVTGSILSNQVIIVNRTTGRIIRVRPFTLANEPETLVGASGVEIVDLRHLLVVPGFVDVHVHLFLHPYSETSWDDQLTLETLVERTVRATNHARQTLLAGFTTVRDLGTEGAGDADVSLRKCINDGLIPGPRYFCANRAIVSTGSYGPKSALHPNREGIEGITGAEVADGVDACGRAVRRQIGAGADWIKIYADYRVLARHSSSSTPALSRLSLPTFSAAELEAMISTAHSHTYAPLQLGNDDPTAEIKPLKPLIRVAAHATNIATIKSLLHLKIDSVEHGTDMFGQPEVEGRRKTDPGESLPPLKTCDIEEVVQLFEESKATWVPTLAAYYTLQSGSGRKDGRGGLDTWQRGQRTFKAALPYISAFGKHAPDEHIPSRPRMRVAVGGDTGVFAHGDNALEMKLMARLGADWRDVLRWGTLGGWACITGNDIGGVEDAAREGHELYADEESVQCVPFGAIRAGWAADLVGLTGDVESFGVDGASFERAIDRESGVRFVMKAGAVLRWDRN
ncbi:hypothetical protein HGRIS_008762 [Hohenbuehelia grisea]|uniref:Amidohydrolase-related domain-containing protein n=1 Tax=Hohenbuehelia grisea TaxID=104357 RepID=A0ABR3J925_9AGAR